MLFTVSGSERVLLVGLLDPKIRLPSSSLTRFPSSFRPLQVPKSAAELVRSDVVGLAKWWPSLSTGGEWDLASDMVGEQQMGKRVEQTVGEWVEQTVDE